MSRGKSPLRGEEQVMKLSAPVFYNIFIDASNCAEPSKEFWKEGWDLCYCRNKIAFELSLYAGLLSVIKYIKYLLWYGRTSCFRWHQKLLAELLFLLCSSLTWPEDMLSFLNINCCSKNLFTVPFSCQQMKQDRGNFKEHVLKYLQLH